MNAAKTLLVSGFLLSNVLLMAFPDSPAMTTAASDEKHGTNLLYERPTISLLNTESFLPQVDDLWPFRQNLDIMSVSHSYRPIDFETQEARASRHKTIGMILMIGGVCLGVGGAAWMVSGLEANFYDTNYMLAVYGGSTVTSVGITATAIGLALFMQGSRGD